MLSAACLLLIHRLLVGLACRRWVFRLFGFNGWRRSRSDNLPPMSSVDLRKRLSFPSRLLWLAALVLVSITVTAAAMAICGRHEDVFASYQREMNNLRITLAAQAARLVQAVDLVLQETQREVLTNGITDPEQFKQRMATQEFYRFFHARGKNLPQADSISLVDADGMVINGSHSWPYPVFNVSDRDYFQYLREHDDPGVFVSMPVQGKLTGEWIFLLARRIDGPRGEFLGVVLAGIQTRYFEEFYQAITLQKGGSVSILRKDGTVLARYPHVETMMGERIVPQSPWYARVAEGGGSNRSPGYIDGVARIVSVQSLRDYPLVISVTISEETALAEWRRQSGFIGLGALGMVVGIIVLFGALAVRSRRSERNTAELAEAAEALRKSEARFRDFALTASDWFWETDEEHRITYVSEGIRAFGQDPSRFIGRSRLESATSGDRTGEKWDAHIAALRCHEPFRNFVYTVEIEGQPALTVSTSGNPLFDDTGRFLGYRGAGRDITDLKAKEIQLHAAMEHLNRVQRIAGIGSIEVDLTTEEERITWSPSACELFGLDAASVEPTPEFILNLIHPDDRAKVKKASDRANRTGTAAPPLEYRIVCPDGTEQIVYRENAIQYDESGEPARRIVTYKDITEIKATEARLRQTQDDLNRAQRLAKVGSDVWNLQTNTVVWSEETYRIFGVDPDTFIPTPENFLDFVVPEDRPRLLDRRQELLRGKPPVATKISIRRPDGEIRHIYSEAELVLDKNGKPYRWVGMRQDITEQTRVEHNLRDSKEAAEAANVAKSQFLANTSHELRTPLNAIIGFSEILRIGVAGELKEKQKEYIGLIHESGQHLLNVINDILDLAHVDSGKFELHEEAGVNVRHIIDTCASLMRDRANAGGLHLFIEIEDYLPLLVADPTRLKQILLNLMSNAIKFTGPGGSVVVTCRGVGEVGFVLEVRDTGSGMTTEEIDIALEPFGQVDASLNRSHEGTGLGLPLARRLAELHGGSLHIRSEKGVGTTVSVIVPASRTIAGTVTGTADAGETASAA
jgi:PAS domain S-box-containing protein